MQFAADSILEHLAEVEAERRRRRAEPELASRVVAVKHYQQLRFARTYSDLLEAPRYRAATRFFLDELYGPRDFSERDAQFARVVPAIARLFPQQLVDVVGTLVTLHALSERLDTVLATHLADARIDALQYVQAWRATGHAAERERQIDLTLSIGAALDRLVRQVWLSHALRLMRGPARAGGLEALQHVLESGFDAFRAMRGAEEFLALVARRERQLCDALFTADLADPAARAAMLALLPDAPTPP